MGEELDLNTYKLQLQQVEAALTSDPTNEELIQLKQDLSQVIELTSQLVTPSVTEPEKPKQQHYEPEEVDELEQAFKKSKPEEKKKSSRWGEKEKPVPAIPVKPWQVGEKCQAPYQGRPDKYYNGKIIEINGDKVSITFDGYTSIESASLGDLKLPANGATTPFTKTSKRELEIKRKEYLKEKKKKKQEKMATMVETKEKEKKQWQHFSGKAFGKRGFVKKSIFKTPESSDGKVGVGTCGVSGQGMTDYNQAAKYRKTSF
jgi:survival-of-motor-neuron-related-splicing factor 30